MLFQPISMGLISMGRAGVKPTLQPIDIAGNYKINNILTNENTNRVLRVFQPFSGYYRRIILQDEFLSTGRIMLQEGSQGKGKKINYCFAIYITNQAIH